MEKELSEMTLMEVEERLTALETEVREMTDVADVEKATEEKRSLLERKKELVDIEERKAQAEKLQNGEVSADKIVEERKEIKPMEERKVYGPETEEYRSAFFANLVNKCTAEQRSIFADNTAYGDGVALPVATDTAIWDQVITAHPILSDVTVVKSGIVMKVTQMTPDLTSAGKGKKDSAAVVELTFTTAEKVLAGKDYSTYVTLSYSESQMSQGAMETFLVNEIANALGEQLAADVFTSVVTDASANKATLGTGNAKYFTAINDALSKATQAQNPVIYAPSALYYAILGEVDAQGQPIVRNGVVLGATLKKDNAASNITILDPAQFVLNVVAETSIKSQDDVKTSSYVIGGYMRAEGCLRKVNAASYIAE